MCIILQVQRYHHTGLWILPLHNRLSNKKNLHVEPFKQAINVGQTYKVLDLIKYIHAAVFSPAAPTWISAINKGYFPILAIPYIRGGEKYLPKIKIKNMGHLSKIRNNQRSTQPITPTKDSSAQNVCASIKLEPLSSANTKETPLIFTDT